MNLAEKRRKIFGHLKNIAGWSTDRKIIIIDSDDWGSIRMPSRAAYERLLQKGLNLNGGDGQRYSLYDTIASTDDLELLYDSLYKFKDKNNIPAVLTANSVVANPDFEKIKNADFQNYYYEPVTNTMKKYSKGKDVFRLWKEGISDNVFKPQFHGREHLNVSLWMNALIKKDKETMLAFNEGLWAFMPELYAGKGLEYEAAFQLSGISKLEKHKEIIKDGLKLFNDLFGYNALYFVPPNGRISNKLNAVCFDNGIRFRSVSTVQYEYNLNDKTKKKYHWLGQSDKSGIKYIVRNCVFEPSRPGRDWVDSCLSDIKIAFKYGKPAIISSHRVNYIGVHDVKNRDNGLKQLNELLTYVLKYWPDVEFMSSDKLGELIENGGRKAESNKIPS